MMMMMMMMITITIITKTENEKIMHATIIILFVCWRLWMGGLGLLAGGQL